MSFPVPQSEPRFLEWDTRFFGARIASVAAHGMSEARWRQTLAWCRAERIRCIYLLSGHDDREQHTRAEAAGAVRVDERTTLSVAVPDAPPGPPDAEIRLACEADLPALRELAASAHTNTRFWRDPRFARERCAEMYAIWIERDLHELATVFVPGPVGEPRGYVTASYASGRALVGLLAVAPSARRQGLGKRLMLRAIEHVRAAGHRRLGFITQGPDNIALRLYESLGSTVERLEIWHHLWFPEKA